MKWFKHYCDAEFSESLSKLEAKYGFEGLGRYWRFVEFLGRNFDGENPEFKFERAKLRALFRFRSWNDLESFADHLAIIPGIDLNRSGNVYEIKAPILLELQSRDFKKARKERGETAPKIKIKNKIKSSSEPQKKSESRTTFSHPKNFKEFSMIFPKEVYARWREVYPDEDWLGKTLEKIYFYFYVAKKKKPSASVKGWVTRSNNWLERDWEKHASTPNNTKDSTYSGMGLKKVKPLPGHPDYEKGSYEL